MVLLCDVAPIPFVGLDYVTSTVLCCVCPLFVAAPIVAVVVMMRRRR